MSSLKLIGAKLAKLRGSHGVSASALAEELGLSRGYLSRVENGRQVISIVILDRIAQRFGVDMEYFFSSAAGGNVVVQRGASGAAGEIHQGDTYTYTPLCAERRHRLTQPFMARFAPGTRTRVAAHDAEYFRYILDGEMALIVRGERYELRAGDSIYYDALETHEVECLGDQPCTALTIFAKRPTITVGAPSAAELGTPA
jgi:transcriptional regulator with XRE-family HTH domain